jgi:predicted RNA-binding protein YlqC (UPF0109 family)
MEQLLTYLTKALVEKPDEVTVTKVSEKEDTTTYQIMVAASDMGRVIGRQGRIAKEIRVLVKNAGMRENKRILVDILD